ncbi:transglycosylase domain-containing protein [Aquibacillus koreensis]|uniref:Transglycosylase domain-containing protein n=1 Tax=Aquibacillus koreensis TaxID=279446 RepID=A0A9X4AIE1_9BACI|nr:transglycosylase domain-containing protein [Aquibacillus koreensis]MCT2535003.1 transglycosylase domain-containing protein [Aquibacillus koreensis]MDC3419290.1 transglycosylase domain-containing protein [Aquibacillus koreensis]
MNSNNFFYKFFNGLKNWWRKGIFQKTSRVTYDVVWNVILFLMVIGVIGMFFAGGVGAGYFASLVKDEEIRTEASMEKDIYNYEETSELYFADEVFLGEINSDLHREVIELKDVSPYVKHAIIATEDEYFETHAGVVPKAIFRAVFQEATNASTKTGGSTLTQQLIKNQVLTNEVSFERKAKEILLALRLERFFEKDEILEAYLNIVPFGRNASGQNIAGIQTAAEGIFGVDAKDINLAQAAFIAGLPQSPSYYTPFQNGGSIKDAEGLEPGLNRMKTVLQRMLEKDYITQSEYDEAMNYDIVANLAEPTSSPLEDYPYLTNEIKQRATDILVDVLATKDGYTKEDLENSETLVEEYTILANRHLAQSGYKIHTTIDKQIYDKFQVLAKEYDNYGRDKAVRDPKTNEVVMVENEETGEMEVLMEPVEVGSILIENETGKILSFVGGRDFEREQTNHATNGPRPNGSTMKPLLVYAPAFEAGVVQPGSIIADTNTVFQYPGMPEPWNPGNYAGGNYGLVSVREALYKSHNVPAAKTYMQIINDDPVSKYLEKMGFSNLTAGDHSNPSMSLGGLTNGVTVEENTNAYATFGNGGKFVDAYMIEKIETVDGEIIYQHESEEPVEVFTPQTNYLMIDVMRDVLARGTATAARAYLNNTNVDWAGKTGTSNKFHDTWFVATNPNVTVGSWMGYDHPKVLDSGYSGRNVAFWSQLVNAATEVKPELMAPSERFERPGGIVSRSYCVTSGKLPSDICSDLGLVSTDIYNANFVPSERDNSLIEGKYVLIDDEAYIVGERTPEEFTQGDGVAFNPEWLKENEYDKLDNVKELIPRSNSGVWADIQIPNTDTEEITDDGQAPKSPGAVQKSGNNLTWNKSSSKDVVGYRIFRASEPGEPFRLIGHTIDLEYNITDNKAVYHVKAVDYFGQESDASKTVEVGDFSEPEPEPEPEPKPKDPKPKPDPKPDNDDNDDNDDEGSDEENPPEPDQQEPDDQQGDQEEEE